jgi:hypothetical protein
LRLPVDSDVVVVAVDVGELKKNVESLKEDNELLWCANLFFFIINIFPLFASFFSGKKDFCLLASFLLNIF